MANILIIDDDETILMTVRSALVKAGHLVVAVKDGHSALDIGERELFDLIISDVNMPGGLSGFSLIATMKKTEKYKNTPVMFLTGRREKKDILRAVESGVDDYMIKPIDYDMMLAKVEALLTAKNGKYSFKGAGTLRDATWTVFLKIENVSEQGLSLQSGTPMAINEKIEISCDIYEEIGIPSPQLRIAACVPDPSKEKHYRIRAHFIGLGEPELQKIRQWVMANGSLKRASA